jgi:hypothetical protein
MEASSALAFNSESRRRVFSQSKMPPQQRDRLLDLFGISFNFGTHGRSLLALR